MCWRMYLVILVYFLSASWCLLCAPLWYSFLPIKLSYCTKYHREDAEFHRVIIGFTFKYLMNRLFPKIVNCKFNIFFSVITAC